MNLKIMFLLSLSFFLHLFFSLPISLCLILFLSPTVSFYLSNSLFHLYLSLFLSLLISLSIFILMINEYNTIVGKPLLLQNKLISNPYTKEVQILESGAVSGERVKHVLYKTTNSPPLLCVREKIVYFVIFFLHYLIFHL